jgi:hypothetical protein
LPIEHCNLQLTTKNYFLYENYNCKLYNYKTKNQQAKTTKFMFDALTSFRTCHLENSLWFYKITFFQYCYITTTKNEKISCKFLSEDQKNLSQFLNYSYLMHDVLCIVDTQMFDAPLVFFHFPFCWLSWFIVYGQVDNKWGFVTFSHNCPTQVET